MCESKLQKGSIGAFAFFRFQRRSHQHHGILTFLLNVFFDSQGGHEKNQFLIITMFVQVEEMDGHIPTAEHPK